MGNKITTPSSIRSPLFSLLKGIGISLVVIGHSGCPAILHDFIYSFHMPLFFLISGFLFNDNYYNKKMLFIKRRLLSLYIPFIIWCVIFVLLHNIFFSANLINDSFGFHEKVYHTYTAKEIAINCIKSLIFINTEPFLGAYWFIKALFFGSIIFLFIQSKLKTLYLLPIICLLYILLRTGLNAIDLAPIGSETIHQSLYATLFISIGHILSKKNLHISGITTFVLLLILIIISQCKSLAMDQNFVNCAILPLSGTIGFIVVHNLSKKASLVNSKIILFFSNLGDLSFYVLTFHFLMFKPISLLFIKIQNLSIEHLGEFPIITSNSTFLWIVYSIFAIITSFLVGKIICSCKQNIKIIFRRKLDFPIKFHRG